ncbi:GPI-linked NAD(P)(+)--arginine ADP-ribosyltransferase 1 isoform X3 [Oxyura jamaicensis]|uniref:GPI-linked NAD(P)(+)--arginine ADP-ribosyltransferase 1 isoform X3 n=1 Tax=Oxyura jamaicensis TaxID=8884 RepID=UPI0015A6F50D|nr:GPI-linked NAD(P)(+)--arginine ADP-ribosyltransferase 1 isoform X3 [Oxyura jamaicensis]
MEHLALGWVLLASTLFSTSATGSKRDLDAIKEVAMDMVLSSFDDQYQGCSRMMGKELEELNRTEFTNPAYAEGWRGAVMEWRNRWGHAARPTVLQQEQAVAVLAYTAERGLYRQFNAAVREGGRSREHYLQSFPFKTLHFLLTKALHTLREAQGHGCHRAYRGIKGTRFTAQLQHTVRFGQFTSASLQKKVAQSFGQDTFFFLDTCYSVPIKNFSFYPGEDEVLIPPFEVFKVTNFTHGRDGNFIHLHSQAARSTYNCEFVKGRSSPREPPHLWSLLLAATALAAMGCL